MKLHQSSSFRKVANRWYHSTFFCIALSIFMGIVFCFSNIGLRLASKHEDYQGHGWVPLVLTALSGIVLAVNLSRIAIRAVRRWGEEE